MIGGRTQRFLGMAANHLMAMEVQVDSVDGEAEAGAEGWCGVTPREMLGVEKSSDGFGRAVGQSDGAVRCGR
jgi:hypothetical protein